MKKINIAELLKDCPSGMELDCTMYDNVYFDSIDENNAYPIRCYVLHDGGKESICFTSFGTYAINKIAKCVIFPKGKTTWEGFVPPCEFKDGDIIFTCALFSGICSDYLITGLYYTWISIFHKMHKDQVITYVDIENSGRYFPFWMRKGELCRKDNITYQRLATEEEKERLFKYIKDNGYKWNEKTKTLEKLIKPNFKVGDVVKDKDGYRVEITKVDIDEECYLYLSKIANGIGGISFKEQDDWELIPNKFDISTLVPFESRVLIRDHESQTWRPAIWGFYDKNCINHPYGVVGGLCFAMCIPYEDNEYLRGKIKDCDKYFKTWE